MARRMSVISLTLLFLSGVVFLQAGQTGAINGVVRNPEGDPLPGVIVLLKSPVLVIPEIEMLTNKAGMYHFPILSPGVYEITYIIEGLETLVYKGIVVAAGKTVTVDIDLPLRSAEESGNFLPIKEFLPYSYFKLTYQPDQWNKFVASYNYSDRRLDHRDAEWDRTESTILKQRSPTHIFNLAWTRVFGSNLFTNLKIGMRRSTITWESKDINQAFLICLIPILL